jgi:retron-type reverse transcriptase
MRHNNSGGRTLEDRPPVAGAHASESGRSACSPGARNFNFNNGNDNCNNRDNSNNNNRVLAVRSQKVMSSLFTFQNLHDAYLECRRGKRNSRAALEFECNAEERLFLLAEELAAGTYHPSPSFCFVSRNDKFREIFAAQFRDRVVHHLLVRHLEKIWEPIFIHDSYACRKGKGTHAAVKRLQSFTHKVTANGTRRAYYLQLDIRAFFPSIDRRLLLDIVLLKLHNEELRWLAELLIMNDPVKDAIFTCGLGKWRNIPPHKSLFSVADGKGLPIGNLTSQFFANIYLNRLDQFVKHTLKARYYIRYVDDFILLHESREQLQEWKKSIGEFLYNELKLELHPNRQIIRPVSNGINTLGYIIRPTHLLVRRRVVGNCMEKLEHFKHASVKKTESSLGFVIRHDGDFSYDKLSAVINSYAGLFSHAAAYGLLNMIFRESALLRELFVRKGYHIVKRWDIPFKPADLYTQYSFFRARFRGVLVFQIGNFLEVFDKDAVWAAEYLGLSRIAPRKGFYAHCGVPLRKAEALLAWTAGQSYMFVRQTGLFHGRVRKRLPCFIMSG